MWRRGTSPRNRARSGCGARTGLLGAVVVNRQPGSCRSCVCNIHPVVASTALIILSKARRRLMEEVYQTPRKEVERKGTFIPCHPSVSPFRRPAHLIQQHLDRRVPGPHCWYRPSYTPAIVAQITENAWMGLGGVLTIAGGRKERRVYSLNRHVPQPQASESST
ncbi:hypothetical protein DFP72DRAFT_635045 [Ephemerocybe angulata]|uniref:Uncharacterized protein n=1 Tax=Ephemerocybe angulata TaxID=980116 RepID=A0A8H6LY95_9AGAR|nr:hypothetical protein DFP72DRAFT_635045 [Tulosesus angulatus]